MHLPQQQLTPHGAIIYINGSNKTSFYPATPSVMFLQNNKYDDALKVLRLLGTDSEHLFILI
jgi:hypothetical protein